MLLSWKWFMLNLITTAWIFVLIFSQNERKAFSRCFWKNVFFRDYLDHICEIGEKCGFSVQEDKLRIPSTKRICFVGVPDSKKSMDNDLLQKLDQNFVPRPSEETVSTYLIDSYSNMKKRFYFFNFLPWFYLITWQLWLFMKF